MNCLLCNPRFVTDYIYIWMNFKSQWKLHNYLTRIYCIWCSFSCWRPWRTLLSTWRVSKIMIHFSMHILWWTFFYMDYLCSYRELWQGYCWTKGRGWKNRGGNILLGWVLMAGNFSSCSLYFDSILCGITLGVDSFA